MSTDTQSGASGDRNPAESAVPTEDNNPVVGLRVTLDKMLAAGSSWEVACKLLARACFAATRFSLSDLPDTPEIDDLRHQLDDVVESYESERSDATARAVLFAYNEVRQEFHDRLEEFVMG